ncbi:hypothetical protein Vi05172_g11004 [Venturia inaequalis]|nr:hypothetical protein Vi05172_g11004 [Venturia inaequalis]
MRREVLGISRSYAKVPVTADIRLVLQAIRLALQVHLDPKAASTAGIASPVSRFYGVLLTTDPLNTGGVWVPEKIHDVGSFDLFVPRFLTCCAGRIPE